ncbi:MAG: 2Fe-2S iron-sulfur cluster-binding protein [Bacteroidetes bacterium]|nr:2Fe-2S iron-sulfur cluster-binding protein [Bacteroidota bacterium]MCL2302253.1 2Fe-2S iron-sulfur cluster-binding protein [Lentimicrobiaceae bacterium]
MKIKINNKEIDIFEGEKLIEAAHRNGVEIPTLCYAPGYQHQASCMVCVVKNCDTGQIIPSCSTVVAEGMNIDTESDELKDLRRQSLELLLSDHIAVCRPPCEPKNCTLRQYTNTYRAKWNKYLHYSAIKTTPPQHISGNLWFDVTKCIRCGLCVYNSKDGFTFKDRGFGMQVVLPEESVGNVDESLWGICPTQALYRSEPGFLQD